MLALLDLATCEPEPHRIQTQTFVFHLSRPHRSNTIVVLFCVVVDALTGKHTVNQKTVAVCLRRVEATLFNNDSCVIVCCGLFEPKPHHSQLLKVC